MKKIYKYLLIVFILFNITINIKAKCNISNFKNNHPFLDETEFLKEIGCLDSSYSKIIGENTYITGTNPNRIVIVIHTENQTDNYRGKGTYSDPFVLTDQIVEQKANILLYFNGGSTKNYGAGAWDNACPDDADACREIKVKSTFGLINDLEKTGYILDGWYTNDGTKIKIDDIVENATSYSLYARWTPETYTVTLNANGGIFTSYDGWKKNSTETCILSEYKCTKNTYKYICYSNKLTKLCNFTSYNAAFDACENKNLAECDIYECGGTWKYDVNFINRSGKPCTVRCNKVPEDSIDSLGLNYTSLKKCLLNMKPWGGGYNKCGDTAIYSADITSTFVKHYDADFPEEYKTYNEDGTKYGYSGYSTKKFDSACSGNYPNELDTELVNSETSTITKATMAECEKECDTCILNKCTTSGPNVIEKELYYSDTIDLASLGLSRSGYTAVAGWYTDSNLKNIYNNTGVTKNITLYAKWK